MTIKISCGICGKNYKVQDAAAGKKLRCKECGEVIRIPEPEAEFGDGDDFSKLLDDAVEEEAKAKSIRRPVRKPMVKAEKYKGDEDGPVTRKKENNYTQDLIQTILFPLDPANLFTFVCIWILLCMKELILPFAGIRLGFLATLIILGWYSNYRFNVIYEATSGRKELPELTPEDGYFIPVVKWAATWLLVHLPAYLYLGIVLYLAIQNAGEAGGPGFLPQDVVDFLPLSHLGVFVFLYCAGLFFWPILALCVAVGGFETVFRIDLMLLTIFKSMGAYFFTAGAMFLTSVVYFFTVFMAMQLGVVGIIIMIAIILYFEIVALRMIGLYYHHFKTRFAWHWG